MQSAFCFCIRIKMLTAATATVATITTTAAVIILFTSLNTIFCFLGDLFVSPVDICIIHLFCTSVIFVKFDVFF